MVHTEVGIPGNNDVETGRRLDRYGFLREQPNSLEQDHNELRKLDPKDSDTLEKSQASKILHKVGFRNSEF